jgi:hypothetical protein
MLFAAVHESALIGQERTKLDFSPRWFVANDPTATLAVHCGNGFDAGFSPYQSSRLSRYNPVS